MIGGLNRQFSSSVTGQKSKDKPGMRRLNFDRLARLYRWMEWLSFGPYLGRCRCAFLPEMNAARRALVLGDGDGRFTASLLKRNPAVHVDTVDVSEVMLGALRRRAGADAGRIRTEARDLRDWSPQAGVEYDLVVTHFFLDCLTTEEVQLLARRLRHTLRPHARWVISEFAVPPGAFGRWVARPVVSFLYRAFSVLTGLAVERLPEWQCALRSAGFLQAREEHLLHGLLTSQVWIPEREI